MFIDNMKKNKPSLVGTKYIFPKFSLKLTPMRQGGISRNLRKMDTELL